MEKDIEIEVTQDDLDNGQSWDIRNCPGYRAIKRRIPSLDSWGYSFGHTLKSGVIRCVKVVSHGSIEIADLLQGRIPFTMTVRVPLEVEVIN